MPEVVNNRTIFSLLEVSRSIQKTISDRYKSLYWIKAEMNKLNHYTHSGHCYPELVEKKEGKIVAELRSVLWKTDYQRINQQFLKVLQEPLREGITILFQAGISYDPMYGLSLKIVDIDPTFVLGELEKEKRESILKLQAERLFDANKQLTFPLIPKRIAIISVETSKGLSDFFKIIRHNPYGYKLECTLYPALLQGDKSIPSIINQLTIIAERMEDYDAVAIIRGGGGEVGLSSYNNYQLAKSIALFPLPVLTGIGHSTNETVSEMVAYKKAITPSELADFLIQRFHNFAIPLDEAQHKIILACQTVFRQQEAQLQQLSQSLTWHAKTLLAKENNKMINTGQRLKLCSRQLLKERFSDLAHLSRIVNMANPAQLLKRGFSITKVNGNTIVNLDQVTENDIIETYIHGGKIGSQVTYKKST